MDNELCTIIIVTNITGKDTLFVKLSIVLCSYNRKLYAHCICVSRSYHIIRAPISNSHYENKITLLVSSNYKFITRFQSIKLKSDPKIPFLTSQCLANWLVKQADVIYRISIRLIIAYSLEMLNNLMLILSNLQPRLYLLKDHD